MSYYDLVGAILNDAFRDMHLTLNTIDRARNMNNARNFIKNCWFAGYIKLDIVELYKTWEKHYGFKHQPLDFKEHWFISNVEFPSEEKARAFWNRNPDHVLSHDDKVIEKAIQCNLIIQDENGEYYLRHKGKTLYKNKNGFKSIFDIKQKTSFKKVEDFILEGDIVLKTSKGKITNIIRNGKELF